MKKTMLILVLLLVSAALFANGRAERSGERGEGNRDEITVEEVTVTGTLQVADESVSIATDDGEYAIGAPHVMVINLDDYDGIEVEVTGVLRSSEDCDEECDFDGMLAIQSAVIDGEEYEFEAKGSAVNRMGAKGSPRTQNSRMASNGMQRPNQSQGSAADDDGRFNSRRSEVQGPAADDNGRFNDRRSAPGSDRGATAGQRGFNGQAVL